MKKYFLFAVFVLFTVTCFSQDYIYLKNGKVLSVTVLHDGEITVRYRNFNDPLKRMYFAEKTDIEKIVYQNQEEDNDQELNANSYTDSSNQDGDADNYHAQSIEDYNMRKIQNRQNQAKENAANRKRSQFHVGLTFPQDDFGDDSFNEGRFGGAATGFNIGYKHYSPLSIQNLYLVWGLEVYYNGLQSDWKEDVEDANASADITFPTYWNIPLTVGLSYFHPLGNDIDFYVEGAIGVNYSKITNYTAEKEFIKYDYDQKKDIVSIDRNQKKYDPAFLLCYGLEAGLSFSDRYTIGLRYSQLGSKKFKWNNTYTTEYYDDGTLNEESRNKGKFKPALSINTLSLNFGVKF
jgi:hypothetical protein